MSEVLPLILDSMTELSHQAASQQRLHAGRSMTSTMIGVSMRSSVAGPPPKPCQYSEAFFSIIRTLAPKVTPVPRACTPIALATPNGLRNHSAKESWPAPCAGSGMRLAKGRHFAHAETAPLLLATNDPSA